MKIKTVVVDFFKLLDLSNEVQMCLEMVEDLDGLKSSRIRETTGARVKSDVTAKSVIRIEESKRLLADAEGRYKIQYEIVLGRIMALKNYRARGVLIQKYLLERTIDEICEQMCRSERLIYSLIADGTREYKKKFC